MVSNFTRDHDQKETELCWLYTMATSLKRSMFIKAGTELKYHSLITTKLNNRKTARWGNEDASNEFLEIWQVASDAAQRDPIWPDPEDRRRND